MNIWKRWKVFSVGCTTIWKQDEKYIVSRWFSDLPIDNCYGAFQKPNIKDLKMKFGSGMMQVNVQQTFVVHECQKLRQNKNTLTGLSLVSLALL